mgnify:FL=1
MRLPCYTFHDGFSTYNHLMSGVLPIKLNYIRADSDFIISRFYKACIGWIRYKPLFLYITKREVYEKTIQEIRGQLENTLPKVCEYFRRKDFMKILTELECYHKNVEDHYQQYLKTQELWLKICKFLIESN